MILAINRRLNLCEQIITKFNELLQIDRDEVTVKIVSASAISDKQEKNIADKFTKALSKKIILQKLVDEQIIGGVKFLIGSKMLDGSVASALQRIESSSKASIINS